MSELEDIYTDLIISHSTNSPNKKDLAEFSCSLHGHNPSCGDDITLKLNIKDDVILDAAFTGEGCAISQSSTSIMIDLLRGKTVTEAKKLINIFADMIDRKKISPQDKKLLKNARAFEGIKDMPARVKCALLPWKTLLNELK